MEKHLNKLKLKQDHFYEERGITIDTPKNQRMGFKQYMRWEWYWSTRLMPDGTFPPTGYIYQEMERYNKTHKLSNKKNKSSLQAQNTTYDWEFQGPKTAPGGYDGIGRVNTIKENPNFNGTTNKIIWAGTASGGLWKSTDAGANWINKTPDMGTLGVGDICINPNNSNEVWLATGDGDAGDAYSLGIMKSTNGGQTWTTTGFTFNLSDGAICRAIVQDPNKPDTMLVATNKGVYRTYDGWATSSRVFNSSTYDLEYKPGSNTLLYLSTYSSVYKSTNGGSTWVRKTNGLPTTSRRVALAVAPSASDIVYAEFTSTSHSGHAGFYKSTNSGENWSKVDIAGKNLLGWYEGVGSDATGGQSWYDLCVVVNPSNANEVYVGGVNVWKSTDGGISWNPVSNWAGYYGYPEVHADHHDLYMPNSSRLYSANDGGVDISTNNGSSWIYRGSGLHCTQFYRIGISQNDTSLVLAGAQDNSSFLKNGSIFKKTLSTGDGFEEIIDYTNDNKMYTSSYYGRWSYSTNKGVSWRSGPTPNSQPGNWLTPYVISPSNNNHIYFAYNSGLYKYDATLGTNVRVSTPNIDAHNLAIAPSNSSAILMGSRSTLKKSSNAGATWSSTTLPQSVSVKYLAYHPTDANKVWFASGSFNSGNKVYYSTNGGSSWTNISGTLPNVPCNTIVCVPEANTYTLFIGMDTGVWYKRESDSDWTQFSSELPAVVVTELEYNDDNNTLFAATYGRGLWKIELEGFSTPPTTPIINTPPDGANQIVGSPTAKWDLVTNATSYSLSYSTTPDFTVDVNNSPVLSTNSYEFENLNKNKTYYIKVKASNHAGSSNWSAVSSFTTDGKLSFAPTANIEISLRLYGRYNSQTGLHDKIAAKVELHDTLTNITNSENSLYSFAGVIGTNGIADFEIDGVTNSSYYLVVKIPGYLPIVFPSKRIVKNGETLELSALQPANIVGGSKILELENSIYYLKAGDINDDLYINAYDAIFIPKNEGTDVQTSFPKP
jgi:hypothetical protein